ncbi:MAG: response regulator transcription factor [Myxococcales bacterium]|nr:MAG: response regulator transcription factor [Myxococcales bacterium]
MTVTKQSQAKAKVLLVEDDPSLALGLCDSLQFEGYQVVHAKTGQEGVSEATRSRPDCVILDLMLPDINGFMVCEKIRAIDHTVPIVMLTARSDEIDKIRGLDAGADDYVTKPFSIGELVARIRAIMRRVQGRVDAIHEIVIGDVLIDPQAHTLTRGDDIEHLSYYEASLLALLEQFRGEPLSRDEILEKVWGIHAGPNNRTVDNCIVKLRKKLEPCPDRPSFLLTVHGVGYKLVKDVEVKENKGE